METTKTNTRNPRASWTYWKTVTFLHWCVWGLLLLVRVLLVSQAMAVQLAKHDEHKECVLYPTTTIIDLLWHMNKKSWLVLARNIQISKRGNLSKQRNHIRQCPRTDQQRIRKDSASPSRTVYNPWETIHPSTDKHSNIYQQSFEHRWTTILKNSKKLRTYIRGWKN